MCSVSLVDIQCQDRYCGKLHTFCCAKFKCATFSDAEYCGSLLSILTNIVR